MRCNGFTERSDRITSVQEEECRKDLNNDDVTRFGLGQRSNFGVVRDSACPFPHLMPHLARMVRSSPAPSVVSVSAASSLLSPRAPPLAPPCSILMQTLS